MTGRLGVVVMAYGTPTGPGDVEAFYTDVRRGRPPSPEQLAALQARYEAIGGVSPLARRTREQAEAVQAALDGLVPGGYLVALGNKHSSPRIEEAVDVLAGEEVTALVGLVLAPHYSAMSVATYYRFIDAAQEGHGTSIEILPIESWHLHAPYLRAVADRVRDRLAEFPPGEEVTVVFSAHSLPERILAEGDPYQDQLLETSRALAGMLDLRNWTFSYQSAGHTAEPWLGPDIVETVNSLADRGISNILIAPIGFVSDHLEILYDIDHEAQAAAQDRGVTLRRTDSLNAAPDFVECLADLVISRLRPITITA